MAELRDNIYMDLRQVAKRLSLSPRTIRGHVVDPIHPLPAYRVGAKLLFNWRDVEQWLEQHRVKIKTLNQVLDDVMGDMAANG